LLLAWNILRLQNWLIRKAERLAFVLKNFIEEY